MQQQQNAIIESIGVFLPPCSVATGDVIAGCKKPLHFPLEKITGIKSRRMAGQQEFSIDLARKAVADCLANSSYDAADIDLLICCNISRYDGPNRVSFEPNTSVQLRKEFHFRNALAFDITNACAGMFTGIYLVAALLRTGAIKRGLVVSGEYITHLTDTAQREINSFMDTRLACLTLGDAGAALILENAPNTDVGFQDLHLQTFGRYSSYCTAKASEKGGMIMYTDSVGLTEVAVRSGAQHAIQRLQQSGWSPDSFHHLIMHQTSALTMNSARKEINRLLNGNISHDGNTINNLESRGNTASTSHFIAVADQICNGKIQAGDRVVFSISASGLTIGTALYVFDNLPDRMRQSELRERVKNTSKEETEAPATSVTRIRMESVGTFSCNANGQGMSMERLRHAADSCLQQSGYQHNDIGLLVYSGVYRDEYLLEPAYAALLAGELDMNATATGTNNKTTLAFDIFNGSLGFLNACYIAQQLITAGDCEAAMIVAAESENNRDEPDAEKMAIQETASAIILDSSPLQQVGFHRFLFRYFTASIAAYTTYCDTSGTKPVLRISKDAALQSLYAACITPVVQELLEKECLAPEQIAMVFPPQISSAFIAQLAETLPFPKEKFVDVVQGSDDLFSSSLPYAFEYVKKNNLAKPGDVGLVIAVGAGIQVGCALYYF